MDLNIFERFNNKLDNKNNLAKNFINELRDFLEQRNKGIEVRVSEAQEYINHNEKVEGYILYYNMGENRTRDEFIKKEDMPLKIDSNSVLRYKNGKFTIDEELTKQNNEEKQRIDENTKKLLKQYKTEGVQYEVLAVEHLESDPSIRLKNMETGFDFSTNDFYKEDIYKLQEGMILQCKDGEYVVPN
jgi:hypothetical protein